MKRTLLFLEDTEVDSTDTTNSRTPTLITANISHLNNNTNSIQMNLLIKETLQFLNLARRINLQTAVKNKICRYFTVQLVMFQKYLEII